MAFIGAPGFGKLALLRKKAHANIWVCFVKPPAAVNPLEPHTLTTVVSI